MDNFEIPLGLGMALAQNPAAMQRFALLGEDEKQAVIAKTHSVRSSAEMRELADNIGR
ncbi:MAG: hypothetical protein ACI4KM_06060 [Oscillospiraceae bacterium]